MKLTLLATNICLGSIEDRFILSSFNSESCIKNIKKNYDKFDKIFIINDAHEYGDNEFSFLPQHMIRGDIDTYELEFFKYNKNITRLTKKTLSGYNSPHNKLLIQKTVEKGPIYLAGFILSLDILATVYDLMADFKDIYVLKDCVGDLRPNTIDYCFNLLSFMNIKVISTNEI